MLQADSTAVNWKLAWEHACLEREQYRAEARQWETKHDFLMSQIDTLAQYLLSIGGPTQNEGAVEMAIRVLKEERQKRMAAEREEATP